MIHSAGAEISKAHVSSSHVAKGELTDTDALSTAVSKSRLIISLLGPQVMKSIPQTLFADFYRIPFPFMRQHRVRRIFAVSTVSIYRPEDTVFLDVFFGCHND